MDWGFRDCNRRGVRDRKTSVIGNEQLYTKSITRTCATQSPRNAGSQPWREELRHHTEYRDLVDSTTM